MKRPYFLATATYFNTPSFEKVTSLNKESRFINESAPGFLNCYYSIWGLTQHITQNELSIPNLGIIKIDLGK